MMQHTAPKLAVLSQTSLAQETVSRHGVTVACHVVVKNAPFDVVVGLVGPPDSCFDFNAVALDVSLIYDCESLKEVACIKSKPITFKSVVNETADQVTCQCRIKVLTSQHEDMLFRVRVRGRTGNHEDFCPPLVAFSAPYKVISKPEQLRTRKERPKKRTASEMLQETVTRLEKQQRIYERLFARLGFSLAQINGEDEDLTAPSDCSAMACSSSSPSFLHAASAHSSIAYVPPAIAAAMAIEDAAASSDGGALQKGSSNEESSSSSSSPQKDAVESLFMKFLEAYEAVAAEERPAKICRIMRRRSAKQYEQLGELVDLLSSEVLGRNIGSTVTAVRAPVGGVDGSGATEAAAMSTTSTTEESCACPSCPHRNELERIDQFYREFFMGS